MLLAYQLQMQGRSVEAERLYLDIFRRNSRDPYAAHQLGLIYRERREFGKALEFMAAAVKADRTSVEALSNYGLILHDLRRYDEAIECFNRALVMDRRNVASIYNRGNALLALGRFEEAIASYRRVLAIAPHHVDALYNQGNALREVRRHDEALASYAQALARQPDYADVHLNEALTRLRIGDFAEGFRKYEWRWRRQDVAVQLRHFVQPPWLGGEPLPGRTILLHAEQGFGDTLQFARYAPLVARQGAKVILEVQPALKRLVEGIEGVHAVIARGDPLPAFDLHCPLLSLPLAFRTELATIPAQVPYLRVPSDRIARWQHRLPGDGRPLIGFVWAGSGAYAGDRQRSLTLGRLAPLLSLPGVQFVCLQREVTADDAAVLEASPQVHHVGYELGDFADTAAIVARMDAVVAVDTAAAHLAGALAKHVFVLLPHSPDFRWLLDRDDSPWYPTARLVRQPAPGDWDSVLRRVREELDVMKVELTAAR